MRKDEIENGSAPSVVDEVRARIDELTAERERQEATASAQLEEANAAVADATAAVKAATEAMDEAAFALAEERKRQAEQKVRLYAGRLEQIRRQQMVTEEDSDRVIDSLRGYLRGLDEGFDAALSVKLKELDRMLQEHLSCVRAGEDTLRTWTQEIHANYRRTGAMYTDPATGLRTNRSPHPVAIPDSNGWGGRSARIVRQFLSNFPTLLSAGNDADEAAG